MDISVHQFFVVSIALFFIVSFIIALFEWRDEIKEARKKLAGGKQFEHPCGLIIRNDDDIRIFGKIRFRAVFLRAFVRPFAWLPLRESRTHGSS